MTFGGSALTALSHSRMCSQHSWMWREESLGSLFCCSAARHARAHGVAASEAASIYSTM